MASLNQVTTLTTTPREATIATSFSITTMHVVCADATGLIKKVDVGQNAQQVGQAFGTQSLQNAIVGMCWAGECESRESEVAVTLASGLVQCRELESGSVVREFTRDRGVIAIRVLQGDSGRTLLTCSSQGNIVCSRFDDAEQNLPAMKVGTDVRTIECDPLQCSRVAIGGHEQLLTVWDIETNAATFRARNVPHNKIELRPPVSISALDFFPDNSNMIVSGTANYQVRLFDVRVQNRRAVKDVLIGEHKITSVCVSPDSRYLYAGDGGGNLVKLDIQADFRNVGRFRGISGSVRDIVCHRTEPVIAAVGLDRFVRVFNTSTRTLQSKVYLKQKLNAVLFSSDAAEKLETVQNNDDEDEDVEEMWRKLREFSDDESAELTLKPKRRKINIHGEGSHSDMSEEDAIKVGEQSSEDENSCNS